MLVVDREVVEEVVVVEVHSVEVVIVEIHHDTEEVEVTAEVVIGTVIVMEVVVMEVVEDADRGRVLMNEGGEDPDLSREVDPGIDLVVIPTEITVQRVDLARGRVPTPRSALSRSQEIRQDVLHPEKDLEAHPSPSHDRSLNRSRDPSRDRNPSRDLVRGRQSRTVKMTENSATATATIRSPVVVVVECDWTITTVSTHFLIVLVVVVVHCFFFVSPIPCNERLHCVRADMSRTRNICIT